MLEITKKMENWRCKFGTSNKEKMRREIYLATCTEGEG